jgi:hypothetical protein
MKKFAFTPLFSYSFTLPVNPQSIKLPPKESSQNTSAGVCAGGNGVGF